LAVVSFKVRTILGNDWPGTALWALHGVGVLTLHKLGGCLSVVLSPGSRAFTPKRGPHKSDVILEAGLELRK